MEVRALHFTYCQGVKTGKGNLWGWSRSHGVVSPAGASRRSSPHRNDIGFSQIRNKNGIPPDLKDQDFTHRLTSISKAQKEQLIVSM